ncbi:MAG: hypothetical protein AABX55_01105 [Nanoarchaeota archaeon]
MKAIVIKKGANEDKAIIKASKILKKTLKKGDIILTSPRLNNIKLKVMHLPSFIISKLSRGITHSCLYLGKGNILEIGHTLYDSKIKKIKIEDLLKNKIGMFRGITVYVVQPKYYKPKHRNLVLKVAINNFLNKSKSLAFSYRNMFYLWMKLIFKKNKFSKKEKLHFKKNWNCSELTAYILKKAGIKIGTRKTIFFLPSTFIFSKHFKAKKKIILK